jgi:hypothetical protein
MRGLADTRFGAIEFYGCPVHVAGSRRWVSPPGRPMLDADGQLLREPDGRPRYGKVIGFMTHGTRRRWSDAILAALDAAHPEAARTESDADDPRLVGERVA